MYVIYIYIYMQHKRGLEAISLAAVRTDRWFPMPEYGFDIGNTTVGQKGPSRSTKKSLLGNRLRYTR